MIKLTPEQQIELQEAKDSLAAWKKASIALATGKSYQINGRSLTRANASEIKDMLLFWQNEVNRLIGGRRSRTSLGVAIYR